MGEMLSIAAIAVLLALVAVSVMKQRGAASRTAAETKARDEGADVQRQRSLRRRAEARAAAHTDQ
jgi:hypothetical protein